MFQKSERVKKQKTIAKLTRSHYRVFSSHFTISALPQDKWQVMVVVSKKIAKLATQRNTLRRRILAILKKDTIFCSFAAAAYQIRITKKGLETVTYQDLQKEVLDGVTKLSKRIVAAK